MARGLIIGQVLKDSSPFDCDVSLSAIRGAYVSTGALVSYKVPMKERKVGGFFNSTTISGVSRPTTAGAFTIAFEWDHRDADNYAKVVGNDRLQVKLTAIAANNELRNFECVGGLIPDAMQILSWIRSGQALQGANKDILKGLNKDLKSAVKDDDFKGIPFSMESNSAMMILSINPFLTW